jgi:hypothetical protein
MTLQQVKEELEEFYLKRKVSQNDCTTNAVMLILKWMDQYSELDSYCFLLSLAGHETVVCARRKVLVDPTVGCIWRVDNLNESFLKQLLRGLPPDEHLSWFDEETYKYWWDYTTKYEKTKHKFKTREEWDVDLNFFISSISIVNQKKMFMGKFSDYMR